MIDKNRFDAEVRRDIKFDDLASIPVETAGDTLWIALCSYFEDHLDRPSNDQISETGWGEWASMKTDEAIDRIVHQIRKGCI